MSSPHLLNSLMPITTMKARKPIIILSLLVMLALVAVMLRSRGYLYPSPNIESVSPDGQQIARLYQLKRMIDKNYRITVRNTKNNALIAEYLTPDEGPLDTSVQFLWNDDSTAVLLVGDVFSIKPTPQEFGCQANAYLLINTTSPDTHLWTAASQNATTPTLTDLVLKQHHFCDEE